MTTTAALTDFDAAGHLLAMLARRPDNAAARHWDGIMRDAIHAGPTGTARAWFTRHNGARVETLQATIQVSGDIRNVWTPGPRTVDASRPSRVALDESIRDYAGLRVVAATPGTLIAATAWGHDVQVCVYALTPAGGTA